MELEEGNVGSSVGLWHPPYFYRESSVQMLQFRHLPHCYCPLLTALFPIVYSLAPSVRSRYQKEYIPS